MKIFEPFENPVYEKRSRRDRPSIRGHLSATWRANLRDAAGFGSASFNCLITVAILCAMVRSAGAQADPILLLAQGRAPLPWETESAPPTTAPPAAPQVEPARQAQQAEPAEIRALRARADGGDVEAMLELVAAYVAGETVPVNNTEGMHWLRRALATGNAEAQWIMGAAYQDGGLGVTMDLQEAARWFQLSADQGFGDAQTELGAMYLQGDGVPQDFNRGYTLLLRAAQSQHSLAMTALGNLFLEGTHGFSQDARQAEYWLQRAIEAGCLQATFLLGAALFSGEIGGLAQDWPRSYRLLRPLATAGVPDAQWVVGYLYVVGMPSGTPNPAEAVQLWTLAAQQGHVDATLVLADAYEQGLGVPANRDRALYWYRYALSLGHEEARPHIERLTQSNPQP